jgi:hypothetical protein
MPDSLSLDFRRKMHAYWSMRRTAAQAAGRFRQLREIEKSVHFDMGDLALPRATARAPNPAIPARSFRSLSASGAA